MRSPRNKEKMEKFEKASWDEAYDFIKNKLEKIVKKMALMLLRAFRLQDVQMRKIIFFKK